MDLINKNKLDPVTMYPTYKITVMLTREEMAVPDRDDDDEDEDYREKLIQVTRIPLMLAAIHIRIPIATLLLVHKDFVNRSVIGSENTCSPLSIGIELSLVVLNSKLLKHVKAVCCIWL